MSRARQTVRSSERHYDALVGAIYDAALGSLPWEEVLPDVVRFFGGERGSFGVRPRGAEADLLLSYNLDPQLLAHWQTEFSGYDPWCERFSDEKLPGELLHGSSEAYFAEVLETHVYAEFFAPAGISDLIATNLVVRGPWRSYLGVYRGPSEGPFDGDDVARAQLLAPHLVRASTIHDRIGALGEEARAAQDLLQSIPYGVILLDSSGAIVWANRRAESHLRSDFPFRVREGALRARDPSLDQKLIAACGAARRPAANEAAHSSQRVSIADGALGRRLEVMVLPVGPRTAETTFSFGARRASVALVLADPMAETPLPAETLSSVLQLPPSLARLASALSSGKTIAEYADETGLSEGTARQQLKELLARGGVRRQADLVRILLRSVAALALPDSISGW